MLELFKTGLEIKVDEERENFLETKIATVSYSEYYSVSNNKTQKLRDYHSEYIDTMLNPNASRISKTKSSSSSIAEIAFGFDDNVLDELVRVMKKIYIYMV